MRNIKDSVKVRFLDEVYSGTIIEINTLAEITLYKILLDNPQNKHILVHPLWFNNYELKD